MTLFTKVPGAYRTREGKLVWVKYLHEGTDYPAIGCKAYRHADGELTYHTNIMQAYASDGRCFIGKDQAEDIVALDDERRAVLRFKTDPPDHDRPVLLRRVDGTRYWIARFYKERCPGDQWIIDSSFNWNLSSEELEWAELP